MRKLHLLLVLAILVFAGCSKPADNDAGSEENGESAGGEESSESGNSGGSQESGQGEENGQGEEHVAQGEAFEGVRNGYFESTRFNIRFPMPAAWSLGEGTEDSALLTGPDGLEVIVANSESVQLADTNFANLNDRVSFDQVNIVPANTSTQPINGMPGYRVEGDALLRGDGVPIYFISQALNPPGEPVMVTTYIPGDYYDLHSDTMKGVLDQIEALDLRPH
ncbi:MAG: hypothetical protein KC561_11805 [Myxococcales bacterium]|nr:hypothetical protein [Myxococcales bacterium]